MDKQTYSNTGVFLLCFTQGLTTTARRTALTGALFLGMLVSGVLCPGVLYIRSLSSRVLPHGLLRSRVRLSNAALLIASLICLGTAPANAENIRIEPEWLQQNMTLPDARHLLGRTGFGASPVELGELLSLTRAEAVKNILSGLKKQPDIDMPSWVREPAPHFWTRRNMEQKAKQAFDRARDAEIIELRRWWVNNMLQTHSPQTERLVLFWHDHFATSYHGVDRRSISVARQNQLFRTMATASYRDLLKAIVRDPAMLRYLDNESNRKGKPNENLARELLELFTLGEGNYDEATVKEAARALTGYGISETRDQSFQFNVYRHDLEEKNLFGRVGHHDGDALIDLILEQPAAAEHLVYRFWHAYISDSAPNEQFVKTLSAEFRQSDYDLMQLYASMLRSEAFWHKQNRLSLIKSPATLLIGTARSLDYPKQAWSQLPGLHALLGMDLFAPPNVAGWTEGVAFVAPGRLLNRQLALRTITSPSSNPGSEPSGIASSKGMMMSTNGKDHNAALQVRLAAHLFRGAPEYKVNLLDSNKRVAWSSDVRLLQAGYDTETFGEMLSMDQLAWHNASYQPPEKVLANSRWAQVEFLNDAADKTGDRNLFVESVSINNRTFSTVGAKQTSHCPPKNRRDAGRLYCAGNVLIDVSGDSGKNVTRDAAYTASNATVLWANRNKQRMSMIISLEHVQTPAQAFHTLSFHVSSKMANELEISLDSYGCWPECVEQWPECANVEDLSNRKRLNFPLRLIGKSKRNCHYQSLSQSEQALVDALYISLPGLLDFLGEKESAGRNTAALQRWQRRIANMVTQIGNSEYAKAGNPFLINPLFANKAVAVDRLPEPIVEYHDLQAVEQMLKQADVSLAQLLIGGLPVTEFPQLLTRSSSGDSSTMKSTDNIEQQLEAVLSHPVYQVY